MMGCKDKNSAPELLYKQHYYGSTEAATIVCIGSKWESCWKNQVLLAVIHTSTRYTIQINQL